MEETKAKYHHLIPQTYMSAWANQSGTLNIEFLKNPGTLCQEIKKILQLPDKSILQKKLQELISIPRIEE